jgi:ribosomal protein L40E
MAGVFRIALVVDSHAWAQALPLSANNLVCMSCGAERPMLGFKGRIKSCASRLRARGMDAVEAWPMTPMSSQDEGE